VRASDRLGAIGVCLTVLLAGCGGGSREDVGCGGEDAAAIEERLNAVGYQTSLVRGNPGADDDAHSFTRVVVRQPGFLVMTVDTYCSPDMARRVFLANRQPAATAISQVTGSRLYNAFVDPRPDTLVPAPGSEHRLVFDAVVDTAEAQLP
jgi:hypothetical protein